MRPWFLPPPSPELHYGRGFYGLGFISPTRHRSEVFMGRPRRDRERVGSPPAIARALHGRLSTGQHGPTGMALMAKARIRRNPQQRRTLTHLPSQSGIGADCRPIESPLPHHSTRPLRGLPRGQPYLSPAAESSGASRARADTTESRGAPSPIAAVEKRSSVSKGRANSCSRLSSGTPSHPLI